MNIILIGFKGAGKSTVGETLAKELGVFFVDTDDIVEGLYKEKEGEEKTVRQIYNDHGESMFRELESAALDMLKEQADDTIIALGGGTLESKRYQQEIKKLGKVIYLVEDKELLFKRIKKRGFPSFYDKKDPKGSFEKLFKARTAIYTSLADLKVDCKARPPRPIAKEIKEKLKQ